MLIVAVDLGDGVFKGARCDQNGNLHPVKFGDAITCPTAVHYDSETKKYLFGLDALHQGLIDRQGLALNTKRYLEGTKREYLHGTATAAEVAALVVKYVVGEASKQAGEEATDVALSVATALSDASTHAYLDAVKAQGLNVRAVLTEPTAAVLGFAYQKNLGSANVLFDNVSLGSATAEPTVVLLHDNTADVRAHESDDKLGGQDIRNALFDLVIERAKKAKLLRPADLERLTDEERLNLLIKCEDAVMALARRPTARVPLTFTERAAIVEIKQPEFESLIVEPYVQKVLACNDRALASAKVKPSDCQYLLPTGGPSRSPYVQRRLSEHLKMPVTPCDDPQRQTVTGVALHAYWQMKNAGGGHDVGVFGGIEVKEVTPWPIGVILEYPQPDGSYKDLSYVLIDKGQRAPQTVTKAFPLRAPHLTSCVCRFVQCTGSGLPPEQCHELGVARFDDIPPEAVTTKRIEVTLTFNSVGMVAITVRDRVSGQQREVSISTRPGNSAAA